ncbi:MAG: D-aminoacylase [Candidatus Bathyarchaeota archaeon]|nr:D-aminoacylase [Candidatus Bathyarchaeota archaeon]
MYDLIIKSGRIVDGTGNPWYRADVALADSRISGIGNLDTRAETVIDAEGLVVAPGFIDSHSHSDLVLMAEPEARQKIMQGVTTEAIGQDGLGEAPIRGDLVDDWRKYLSGLNGDPDIEWGWRSFGDYLDALERAGPSTNVVALVGHGNLRLLAMGMENRSPTDSELEEMKRLLSDSMKEGAHGMSTGLIYSPCVYADTGELTELCDVVSAYGGVFVVHMRNEGDRLIESIGEVVGVGRKTCVPIHISHFKASGEKNWGKSVEALERLERAREAGVDVTADQYPYVAGSTFLSSLLPVWMHEGGTEKMLARLETPDEREKAAAEMTRRGRGTSWGWGNVMVTSVKTERNRRLEGKTLEEIAGIRMQTPLDALFDIVLEEENAATMVGFSMSEGDVRTIMQSPCLMVCTDGIVLGRPHPRAYGSFPRVIGRYVRGGVLRLEEAVRKMTSLPAQRFGIHERGLLKPGMCADITIFDPNTVIDTATYEDPIRFPKGIEYVIVNGEVTVEKGAHTEMRAGKILRHRGKNIN